MAIDDTIKIKPIRREKVDSVVKEVYSALEVKGYDPIAQIAGYLLSRDPTYITSYNGARSKVTQVDVFEILERAVEVYIETIIEHTDKQ